MINIKTVLLVASDKEDKMEVNSKIIGYFLLHPKRAVEGFADTSLENFVNSGHGNKLPFLNGSRLQTLLSSEGISRQDIISIENRSSENPGWPASKRFLHQMFKSGRYAELQIPEDKVLITTNRKTIIKLIETLSDEPGSRMISVKGKFKSTDYHNKCLGLSYSNEAETASFFERRSSNKLVGLSFESYLTYTEDDSESSDHYTLFSIHFLEIGSVCFVYESEIDAIEQSETDTGYAIVEIKLEYKLDQVKEAFQKYKSLSQVTGKKNDDLKKMLGLIKDIEKNYSRFYNHFLQGELGNVHKYVCGFVKSDRIHGKEFPGEQGKKMKMKKELRHLDSFVKLIEQAVCVSKDEISSNDWVSWKILKEDNYVRIVKDEKILAEVEVWNTVYKKFRSSTKPKKIRK